MIKIQTPRQARSRIQRPTIWSLLHLVLVGYLVSSCKLIDTTGTTELPVASTVPPADFVVIPDPGPTTSSDSGNTTLPPIPSSPTEPTPDDDFVINDHLERTNTATVPLVMQTLTRNEMKIGAAPDCTDGLWQPWLASLNYNLPLLNQSNTISVQFKDYDNNVSACIVHSIIHDNMGPEILFQAYPSATVIEGAPASIAVKVTDALSAIETVTCALGATPVGSSTPVVIDKGCFSGLNTINITAMPVGNYFFEVTATDELGNSNQSRITWIVNSATRRLSQDIQVDEYKKVDILFVIDNSGSMEFEQASMGSRTSQFLSILHGLDWQIGITTTDPRNIVLGNGRLIPLTVATEGKTISQVQDEIVAVTNQEFLNKYEYDFGHSNQSQYLLNSTMDENQSQQTLSNTLQRREVGSGSEQGIRAAYKLVERFTGAETQPRSFFRDGSQFAVVVISDEDESDDTIRNDPESLIGLVNTTFSGQKRFSFHSIVTKPNDTQCRSTEGYGYGYRYKIISDLTGGFLGSVCEASYAAQVQSIAERIRNLLKTLTLQCAPQSGYSIVVTKDGATYPGSFTVEGVNLRFDTELSPGNYQVQYSCLK